MFTRNQSICLAGLLTLLLIIGGALLVRRDRGHPATEEPYITPLIPELQDIEVASIDLTKDAVTVSLKNRLDGWWLIGDHELKADDYAVNSFLLGLAALPSGKVLTLDTKQAKALSLTPETASFSIRLRDHDETVITLNLGDLNQPHVSEYESFVGAENTYRRFLRVDGATERFVLNATSFAGLSIDPGAWVACTIPPISSFQSFRVLSGPKAGAELHREGRFTEPRSADKELLHAYRQGDFQMLALFLRSGHIISPELGHLHEAAYGLSPDPTFEVVDFLGIRYRYHLGRILQPSQDFQRRRAMQANVLDSGDAPTMVYLSYAVSLDQDRPLDTARQRLREERLAQAKSWEGKVLRTRWDYFSSLCDALYIHPDQ